MQQSTPTSSELNMESTGTTHANMKHNSGEFLCRMCNKSFAFKKNYDDHHIVHDVEQICGPGVVLSVQNDVSPAKKLKIHACDQCDKSYHRKDHLTRHKLEHTGERPHICIVCLKSFVRKDKLTRHEKIHYKDSRIQFNCPDCNRKFLRKDSMEKHRKSHGEQAIKGKPKCTCAANATAVDNTESVKSGVVSRVKSGDLKSGNDVNNKSERIGQSIVHVTSGCAVSTANMVNIANSVFSATDADNGEGNTHIGNASNVSKSAHESSSVNNRNSIYSGSAGGNTLSMSKSEGYSDKSGNSLHSTGAYKSDSQAEVTVKSEIENSAAIDSAMKQSRCEGSVENMQVPQPRGPAGYWFDPRQGHGHPHFFNPASGFTPEMDLRVNYHCQLNCNTAKNSSDHGWSK
ncbi:zinc finger protein 254-like [Ruditapes philippinarum]|uniref:zinc finger protein 254-like n=1 Tax=Ruditapes philippinarum TaxID=129788 RepID=UPI00295ABBB3|nr:zinc finger protein 254-like [Ruditapes philippinarum]